eukprot:GFKZ01007083.1.p1 GENE.GFKZ01007083.1~~GFKZ01007083.1.p1  ORF type:complete len:237 (+),score=34.77 GFKZ01007083.1:283-993(+)
MGTASEVAHSALECRICREGSDAGELTSVCRCSTQVHPECLRRWVAQRADALFPLLLAGGGEVCEICRAPLKREVLVGEGGGWVSGVKRRVEGGVVWMLSVEGCLLMFLFVLAVLGHVLFVVGVYDVAEGDEDDMYSLERVAMGVLNAVLTMSLLVLVQKIVSRWLRERDFLIAVAAMDCGGDVERGAAAGGGADGRHWGRCGGVVCQIALGTVLSVLAAAEIFFLMTMLPIGEMK